MPVKTGSRTEEEVRSHKAPVTSGRQSEVFDHGVIIDEITDQLTKKGYTIYDTEYRGSTNLNVVHGVFYLGKGSDPNMGKAFTFSNNYEAPNEFVCSSAAYEMSTLMIMIPSYLERTPAKTKFLVSEGMNRIVDHTSLIRAGYDELIKWKETLINTGISAREQATIIGRLYAQYNLLTLTQIGMVKKEIEAARVRTKISAITAWEMYQNIQVALMDTHPRTIIESFSTLQDYFMKELNAAPEDFISKQTEEAENPKPIEREPVKEEKVRATAPQEVYKSPMPSVVFL